MFLIFLLIYYVQRWFTKHVWKKVLAPIPNALANMWSECIGFMCRLSHWVSLSRWIWESCDSSCVNHDSCLNSYGILDRSIFNPCIGTSNGFALCALPCCKGKTHPLFDSSLSPSLRPHGCEAWTWAQAFKFVGPRWKNADPCMCLQWELWIRLHILNWFSSSSLDLKL